MPFLKIRDASRPDVLMLNDCLLFSDDEAPPYRSFTVIELKRPMLSQSEGNKGTAFDQVMSYVDKLRKSELVDRRGRTIPGSSVPVYCYIIADLSPAIDFACKMAALTKMSNGMGYFGYIPAWDAYMTVMSYDCLLSDAIKRNEAFFQKLGMEA